MSVLGVTALSPTFTLSLVGTSAKATEVDGQFIVLAGSTARRIGTEAWENSSRKTARDQLIESGKLEGSESADYLVFVEDVAFGSPSGAASAVLGQFANGRIGWKVEGDGQTYAQWQEAQIDAVGGEVDGEE